ncbi:MAG: hypothetical protein ABII71_01600 [Candidatus Micrarchaeota archaeon]
MITAICSLVSKVLGGSCTCAKKSKARKKTARKVSKRKRRR